ncbi:putative phage holin LL-H family [Alistipes sp. CAG:831]|nr:putative phage holin LL-H family [Alistipes sp. CAG:831]
MKTIFKVLTYVVFPIAIIVLVYLNYESIMEPVRFDNEVERREAVAIDRLVSIRTLQEAYKTGHRRFLSTTDSLIDFYKNGKITIVRQIGSMDDSVAVAEGRVSRDSIEIFVRDTLLKGKGSLIDSISFIPFSGGKRINMQSVVRKVSGIEIPLFEATIPYDDLLNGLDRQLIVNLKAEKEDMHQYTGLKVGDIENPNNNAGNWE